MVYGIVLYDFSGFLIALDIHEATGSSPVLPSFNTFHLKQLHLLR